MASPLPSVIFSTWHKLPPCRILPLMFKEVGEPSVREPTYTTRDILEAELAKGETLDLESVAYWCETKVFPNATKVGGRWRIPASDYDPATFVRPAMGRRPAEFGAGELSVSQIAERTGHTPETVRNWIYSGKLKATRVGDVYKILETDLQDFLAP